LANGPRDRGGFTDPVAVVFDELFDDDEGID
jgi:hypothetical protein